MSEPDKFFDTIKETGEGVLRITIPKKLAEGLGLKQGNKLKVWIKKIEE